MARTQTMVQLSDDILGHLDTEAKRKGQSRSALIREILQTHIDADDERRKIEQYVEGYRKYPQGEFDVDEWGDLHEQLDRQHREMARSLDAEEAAAGLPEVSW